ncbi:MAG: hypothetical protein QNI90_07045 [Dinoroseobacter sp.]|nr:hypothetical protein [Dinoroseobacter sp.]
MSDPKSKNEPEKPEDLETEIETPEEKTDEIDASSKEPEQPGQDIEEAEVLDDDETVEASTEANETQAEDSTAESDDNLSDPVAEDAEQVDETVEDTVEQEDLADVTPEPDTAEAANETTPPPSQEKKSGGFFGTFLGGVVAAGLGFGLCYYLVNQGILGTGGEDAFAEERAQIGALQEQIAVLQTQVAEGGEDPRVGPLAEGLSNTEGLISALQGEIDAVQSEVEAQEGVLAGLGDELGTVNAQLDAIADMPVGTGGAETAAVAALQAQLQAQQAENSEMQAQLQEMAEAARAEMEDVRARAGALQAETQAAVDEATNRAALANLTSSIESGTPLAAALASITGDVPEALSAVSDSGVKTVLELQNAFPAAARAGLSDSLKVTVGDDPGDRIMAFLQSQVGARSLEAREGDDPDAILARAQEAVSSARFADALAEIATLPDEGQAAMAGWTADAQARVDAVAARDALTAELISN